MTDSPSTTQPPGMVDSEMIGVSELGLSVICPICDLGYLVDHDTEVVACLCGAHIRIPRDWGWPSV